MKRIPSLVLLSGSLSGLVAPTAAQNPCYGSGSAYLTTTPAVLGGQCVMSFGSPAAPNGIGLLLWGNGGGASHPFCLDTSALFVSFAALLDGAGNAPFTFNVPASAVGTTLFAKALVLDSSLTWSLSKTVRVATEFADSYAELPALATGRSLHTCTAFEASPSDNVVGALVAGGATGNLIAPVALAGTEVFDSITRTWSAGPTMAEPRSRHAAARMLDGTILISGGMTNAAVGTGGPATTSCELYVPQANVLTPFAPMLQPRLGHAMTVLPDGRVLVSGGFTDWTNAGANFVARLNSVQSSTEIWDPATGLWAAGPTMASARGGHTQTLLPNGKVLIAGGCNGGTSLLAGGIQIIYVPVFTATCEIFDPATNLLTPTAPLGLPLGFHGASVLGTGNVLLTGGAANIGFYGEAAATNACRVYDVAAGTWTDVGGLPTGVAFHTQETLRGGAAAVIVGGFIGNFQNLQGTTSTATHDGVTATARALLGTNPGTAQPSEAVGTHAAALMHDGTLLVTGGFELASLIGGLPTARSFLYVAP